MQGRYAIILDEAGPCRTAAIAKLQAIGLSRITETGDFAILASGTFEKGYTIENNIHFLGMVISRTHHVAFGKELHHPNTASRLIASKWGAYVAINSANHDSPSITRDPSGQVPCYFSRSGSSWTFTSDAALLRALHMSPLQIDWNELQDILCFPGHFGTCTAIQGVRELLPGETATVRKFDVSISAAWTPWAFCGAERCKSPQDATQILEAAFSEVHDGLAQAFGNTLISVSGGLDSAIVTCELHRAAATARCVNFFTNASAGDERHFARKVAESCAFPLVEIPFAGPDLDSYSNLATRLPRPTERFMSSGTSAGLQMTAIAGDHDAILTGYGGDSVFCYLNSSLPLVDLLQSRAPTRELIACLNAIGTITGASFAQIALHTARNEWRRARTRRPFSWAKRPTFLAAQVRNREQPLNLHPWLQAPKGAFRGKAGHVAAILRAHNHLGQSSQDGEVAKLAPLLFAPIVEACLSIPTWLWITGGRNRSIARTACRTLPTAIAKRVSKGTPGEMYARFFEQNVENLTAFLLEGELASRNIVDTDSVHRYARSPFPKKDNDYLALLELVDAERWVRSWL